MATLIVVSEMVGLYYPQLLLKTNGEKLSTAEVKGKVIPQVYVGAGRVPSLSSCSKLK